MRLSARLWPSFETCETCQRRDERPPSLPGCFRTFWLLFKLSFQFNNENIVRLHYHTTSARCVYNLRVKHHFNYISRFLILRVIMFATHSYLYTYCLWETYFTNCYCSWVSQAYAPFHSPLVVAACYCFPLFCLALLHMFVRVVLPCVPFVCAAALPLSAAAHHRCSILSYSEIISHTRRPM